MTETIGGRSLDSVKKAFSGKKKRRNGSAGGQPPPPNPTKGDVMHTPGTKTVFREDVISIRELSHGLICGYCGGVIQFTLRPAAPCVEGNCPCGYVWIINLYGSANIVAGPCRPPAVPPCEICNDDGWYYNLYIREPCPKGCPKPLYKT